MTEVALVLWQVVLWGLLGLALIAVMAIWLFVTYSVVRTIAEFMKAFKETKNLDLDEEQESW